MAKKHWIYIKRGLSEDPKHRAAMGECIWLYMHIIDRADWETGIAYNWKDSEEAADMSMEPRTLRYQRQKLEKLDYIRCKQKQHGQDIKLMEWVNPRDYSAGVVNPRNSQGDNGTAPSKFQGDNHDDNHDDNQGRGQIVTPTSTSESDSKSKRAAPRANDFPSNVLFREVTEKYPAKANWHTVLKFVSDVEKRLGRMPVRDDLFPFYESWCAMGWNPHSINWMEYAVRGVLPSKNGSNGSKPAPAEPKGFVAIRQWLGKEAVSG